MKTLKDIKTIPITQEAITITAGEIWELFIHRSNLKQAAIEWIKSLLILCAECGKLLTHDYEGELSCPMVTELSDGNEVQHTEYEGRWDDLGTYNFIMEFFNITEEDLK